VELCFLQASHSDQTLDPFDDHCHMVVSRGTLSTHEDDQIVDRLSSVEVVHIGSLCGPLSILEDGHRSKDRGEDSSALASYHALRSCPLASFLFLRIPGTCHAHLTLDFETFKPKLKLAFSCSNLLCHDSAFFVCHF